MTDEEKADVFVGKIVKLATFDERGVVISFTDGSEISCCAGWDSYVEIEIDAPEIEKPVYESPYRRRARQHMEQMEAMLKSQMRSSMHQKPDAGFETDLMAIYSRPPSRWHKEH